MSHWTKCELQVTDEEILVKALKRMGCEARVSKRTIKPYGTSATADIWIDDAVGFKKEKDGTYSMIGDFYHSNDSVMRGYYNNVDKFDEDLSLAYAVEDATTKLESLNMGFDLTGNAELEEDEDGLIRLEFTTYYDMS